MGDLRAYGPARPERPSEPGWRARLDVVRRLRRLETMTERRDLCTLPQGPQGRSGWTERGPGAGMADGLAPVPRTVPVEVAVDGVPVVVGGRATRWGCDWHRHADRIRACGSGRILGADGVWMSTRCRSPWCPTCVHRAGRARSGRWVKRARALSAAAPTVRWGMVTLTCAVPARPSHVSEHEWRAGWRPAGGLAGVAAGPVDVAHTLAGLQDRWRRLRQGARPALARSLGYLYGYESTTSRPVIDPYWDREGNRWRCRACGETGARRWATVKGRRRPVAPEYCPSCRGRKTPEEHLHLHVVFAIEGDPVAWGLGVAWRWLELCEAEGVEASWQAQHVAERPPEQVAYVVAYPGTDPSLDRTDGQWCQWWAGVRGAHLWQAGGGFHRGSAKYRRAMAEYEAETEGWPHGAGLAALGRAWVEVPPSDDDGGWVAMALVDSRTGLPEPVEDQEGAVLRRSRRGRPERTTVVGLHGEAVPTVQAMVGRRLLGLMREGVRIAVWMRDVDGWACEVVDPQRILGALGTIPPPIDEIGTPRGHGEKPGRYPTDPFGWF